MNKFLNIRPVHCLIIAICSVLFASGVQAQQPFPSKPVHIVVPYLAGGIGDQLARAIQKPMQEFLGQPVIVDNMVGAGGVIGTAFVARAPRDGYTLVLGNTGPLSISPQVSKLAYNPRTDLVPVSGIAQAPLLLAVPTSSTAKTVSDFLRDAKASGTTWNFGSTGVASLSHLSGEYLNHAAGLQLTHVPYNGGAQMVAAFVGGDLQAAFVTGPDSAAMLQSGKIRYLAVASTQPTNIAPGLPTVAEGVPGFASDVWYGIMAPAGTPAPVVARLQEAIAHAVGRVEAERTFAGRYIELRASSPDELAQRIERETQRWGAVIQDAKLQLK
jgi:tripartite-type tricarboxylate transporter receptor subunit TctC